MQRDVGLIPGSGRSSGGRHGNPLQYSCLENPHGQRSLAGYNPWGPKDSDMTETIQHTHTHTHTQPYYIPMVYSISRLPKWLLHSFSVPKLSIIPLHWWSCLWFIEKIKVTRIQFPHSSPHLSCPNIWTCIFHRSKSRSYTFALDPVPSHLPRVLALAINPFLLSDIYASLATGSLPSVCRHASLSSFSLKI